MERVADVEEVVARAVDGAVRAVREPGRGERAQRLMQVAQPAAGLLEVGFDEVGEFAEALGARARSGEQVGEAVSRGAPPVRKDRGARLLHQGGVAADEAQVEQSRGGGEVAGRDLAALGEGADGVIELEPRVPDRIPEALGELGELLLLDGRAVVEEQEVEVARRPGVAARDRADGRERDARLACRREASTSARRGRPSTRSPTARPALRSPERPRRRGARRARACHA